MKKILLYMENKYPNIPTNDKEAYLTFESKNDLYNKLLLSQLQNLDAAPVGITPIEFPVIIKPIINLYGMSNGLKKINNIEEFREETNYGMFWQKYLDGIQYNLDINMKNGKIIQYFCVISEPDKNGMFKYHYYERNYNLSEKIYCFIEEILYNYTGFVNIEIINGYIIELHLRLNGDLFLYSEKNIDDMIKGILIKVNSTCFFPIFVNKYLNINICEYLDSINIEYDLDETICNDNKRLLYFRQNNLEEGIDIQNKIYEYVNNYILQDNINNLNFFC
jgi:hypothetical protein